MDEEQKKFSNEVNCDKAKIKVNVAMIILILSLTTYIPALIMKDFDFGFIFEAASFVFLIIARINLSKYNAESAKGCLIISFLSVGWLFIYDIFRVVIVFLNSRYVMGYGYTFYIYQAMAFTYLSLVFLAIKALSKAIDPVANRESTDWFYETVDKDKENK